ncbi:CoA ester lyase [Massilia sp. Mn16-1_5]|uniref:HpcH/HpaI aldolase/citrate lyase family protein n=1 Tax=Massilia sp. Mn16-1_5 TaxID=2079199 RepID=UPI00109E42D4|nr:CoA ester lyase [Massilia sp. Mn16-1_5]THC45483.1 CoA ester lyase [Massilia sp. Mn16-1_5]
MTTLLPRSYLFVPANRPDRFDKACQAGADAVIVDLEDAVPCADKSAARAALAAWLAPAHPVCIRINGADTEWFAEDLALCSLPGVSGVVLSKAEEAGDLARLHAAAAPAAALLPLVESAAGIRNLDALARAPGVQRLLFGSIDFQLDMGIRGEREELLFFRSQLVLASRLAGIGAPVDGVTPAIDDSVRLRDDAGHARRMGFGGKLCIHPRQLDAVHRCFSPDEEELAWAARVVEAAARSDGAAVALDGKMIDRPLILRARQILDEAAARRGCPNSD